MSYSQRYLWLAAGALVWLGGCTWHRESPSPSHGRNGMAMTYAVAQVGTPRGREFALCIEPACPQRSLKTVAAQVMNGAPTTRGVALRSAPQEQPAAGPDAAQAPSLTDEAAMELQFAPGSSELSDEAQQVLKALLPRAQISKRIIVVGRTDSHGAADKNDRVAMARADAVKRFLAQHLSPVPTIEADGKGLCCYVGNNATVEGRTRNRRAEVKLVVGR